ncbi:MAG: hypothetical protein U0350_23760 [Caldilineaceae bacterium]
MNKQAYQLMTTTLVAGLLLVTTVVAPVAAQSSTGMDQGSSQNQAQAQNQNQAQGQSANSNQANPCLSAGQNAGQNMNQTSTDNSGQTMNQSPMIGTGTDNAGAPLDCWLALNAHQSHWYKFRYGYNSDQDDSPNQATVKLSMDTPGCVSFEVWTQERLNAAQNGVTDDDKQLGPVGTGSPEYAAIERDSTSDKNQNPAKLIWVGSQTGSATFYVVVKNHREAACNYRLSISGFSVSFPSHANTTNQPSNTTSSNNG